MSRERVERVSGECEPFLDRRRAGRRARPEHGAVVAQPRGEQRRHALHRSGQQQCRGQARAAGMSGAAHSQRLRRPRTASGSRVAAAGCA